MSFWNAIKYPTFEGVVSAASSLSESVAETASAVAATVNETVEQSDILSSVKETLTETASQVAESAGSVAHEGWLVAERFRLEEAQTGLKQDIELTKRKWGSSVWAAMEAGNLDAVRVNFERAKRVVDDLEAQLVGVQAELDALDAEDDADDAEGGAAAEGSRRQAAAPAARAVAAPPAQIGSPPAAVSSAAYLPTAALAEEPYVPRDHTPLADGKGGWHTSKSAGGIAGGGAPAAAAASNFEAMSGGGGGGVPIMATMAHDSSADGFEEEVRGVLTKTLALPCSPMISHDLL